MNPKTTKILLPLIIFFLFLSGFSTGQDSLVIDTDQSKDVTPIVYGWHYEEIGMIGEGGLYAEMVRNRALEEANPPEGMVEKEGDYAFIPGAGSNPRKKP